MIINMQEELQKSSRTIFNMTDPV